MRRAIAAALCGLIAVTACEPWADEDLEALGPDQSWQQLSLSIATSCGLGSGGAAFCWGGGFHGSVSPLDICPVAPDPFNPDLPTEQICNSRPIAVSGGHSFAQIVQANSVVLAIDNGGMLWGWGGNDFGALGDFTADSTVEYPRLLPDVAQYRFSRIAGGGNAACGVTTSGTIICWGVRNLMNGGVSFFAPVPCPDLRAISGCIVPPAQIGSGTSWVDVAVGNEHACALDQAGDVYCWGAGNNGQLGSTPLAACAAGGSSIGCQLTPTKVSGTTKFESIAATWDYSCGIATSGGLRCWGNTPGVGTVNLPTQVGLPTGWSSVAAGLDAACAVRDDGTLWCMGRFQLGFGAIHQIAGVTSVAGAAVGWTHACAWTTNGEAWCFGSADAGQLGDGAPSLTFVATPVRVSAPYRN